MDNNNDRLSRSELEAIAQWGGGHPVVGPVVRTALYLAEALDYIDGHNPDDAGTIAAAALAGTWVSPECCYGHGFERRRAAEGDSPDEFSGTNPEISLS